MSSLILLTTKALCHGISQIRLPDMMPIFYFLNHIFEIQKNL
ncbi:hypothetical protein D1AOALGA4SA_7838 [Olavius algarvensis Delta 1 endosymbiont]|nr:hypothetical protein D1AOALGA4SA_7838 [Olavius algarvensis Delta 1 endosymbiont]